MLKITEKKKTLQQADRKMSSTVYWKFPSLPFSFLFFLCLKFSALYFFAVSWGKGIVLFPKILSAVNKSKSELKLYFFHFNLLLSFSVASIWVPCQALWESKTNNMWSKLYQIFTSEWREETTKQEASKQCSWGQANCTGRTEAF